MEDISLKKVELEKFSVGTRTMSEKRDKLTGKVLHLQCRSMKYNLVFTGLGGESRNENTIEKLHDLIYYELEIEHRIVFCNVHRFGRFIQGKDCPIVAKFIYNEDRDLVMRNTYRLEGSS
jgi:hypothetical protein